MRDNPNEIYMLADDYTLAELEHDIGTLEQAGFMACARSDEDHTWIVALKIRVIDTDRASGGE
jgi:hypothetical protein